MTDKVIVIGAGQLGSRHIQGLAKVASPIDLYVFDPSQDSLNISKQRLEEITTYKGTATFSTELPKDQDFALAVISTNSNVRRSAIEKLVDDNHIQYMIIEKFLFQSAADYDAISDLLDKKKIKAWVNCPRRMYPVYQMIKALLTNETHVHFSVSSSTINLGSNAIHFLDLFSYLSGDLSHEVTTQLDPVILQSKRNGYIEFTGNIFGKSDKISFDIHSYSNEGTPIMISIQSPNYRFIIHESSGEMMRSGVHNNWIWEKEKITIPFQSNLTNIAYENIKSEGDCILTPYEDSKQLHLKLLKEYLKHYNTINSTNLEICPIT